MASTFTVQQLAPEGWLDFEPVGRWDQVEAVIAEHDTDRAEGDPGPGWIVARADHMTVHSRKDGRWRVIEKPEVRQ